MKTIIGWALVAGFVTVGALILATRWIITHPAECDRACRAQREAQWRRMAN
jgi:hypothetical protein